MAASRRTRKSHSLQENNVSDNKRNLDGLHATNPASQGHGDKSKQSRGKKRKAAVGKKGISNPKEGKEENPRDEEEDEITKGGDKLNQRSKKNSEQKVAKSAKVVFEEDGEEMLMDVEGGDDYDSKIDGDQSMISNEDSEGECST